MAKKKRKLKARPKPQPLELASLSEQATAIFRQELRQSELWAQMVAEFGEAEAERLLQQMRLDMH